ncbi:MAG: hypothetical protein NWF00_10975 [Candidatus Bathyarchaeota archaeon]|nr:hypothetical protein [Candidatus Bathyarchaeota archaeon]
MTYRIEQVEPKIIEIIAAEAKLVSVGWVAKNLGVSWATARLLLGEIAEKKKLKKIETTRSNLYALN